MTIIAVDDEALALDGLLDAIAEVAPDTEVHGFRKGEEVLAFGQRNLCDVAFLEVQLKNMAGIL